MGWTPRQVGETGLAEFNAAFDGWAEANGLKKRRGMSKREAKALRRELGWD